MKCVFKIQHLFGNFCDMRKCKKKIWFADLVMNNVCNKNEKRGKNISVSEKNISVTAVCCSKYVSYASFSQLASCSM